MAHFGGACCKYHFSEYSEPRNILLEAQIY